MCKLMDQNALFGIRVTRVAKQVFFAHAAVWIFFRTAGATRTGIPPIPSVDTIDVFAHAEPGKLGEITGVLLRTNNTKACPRLNHCGFGIRARNEQLIHPIRSLTQGVVVDIRARNDRKPTSRNKLRVLRSNLHGLGWLGDFLCTGDAHDEHRYTSNGYEAKRHQWKGHAQQIPHIRAMV